MTDELKQILCDLIERHGRELLREPKRLEGMLNDACSGQHRGARRVLVDAVQERVVEELLALGPSEQVEVIAIRAQQRLIENFAIAPDAAQWAVQAWVAALRKTRLPTAETKTEEKGPPEPPVAALTTTELSFNPVLWSKFAKVTAKLIKAKVLTFRAYVQRLKEAFDGAIPDFIQARMVEAWNLARTTYPDEGLDEATKTVLDDELAKPSKTLATVPPEEQAAPDVQASAATRQVTHSFVPEIDEPDFDQMLLDGYDELSVNMMRTNYERNKAVKVQVTHLRFLVGAVAGKPLSPADDKPAVPETDEPDFEQMLLDGYDETRVNILRTNYERTKVLEIQVAQLTLLVGALTGKPVSPADHKSAASEMHEPDFDQMLCDFYDDTQVDILRTNYERIKVLEVQLAQLTLHYETWSDRRGHAVKEQVGHSTLPSLRWLLPQWFFPPVDKPIWTNSIDIRFARIPAGEFMMGTSDADVQNYLMVDSEFNANWTKDEQPQHRVKITNPFCMATHEVTQSQYQQVLGRNPSYFSRTGRGSYAVTEMDTSRFPVEDVSWFDAVEFCVKLSALENRSPYYRLTNIKRDAEQSIKSADVALLAGNGYRLPTEAEWEYACRAGSTTPFHSGKQLDGGNANINGEEPFGTKKQRPSLWRTTTVGSYKPNAFSLYDMHGNVSEWCQDSYDESYYALRVPCDPAGSSIAFFRVYRGGSWNHCGERCRSAIRARTSPGNRDISTGFRLVTVLPAEA